MTVSPVVGPLKDEPYRRLDPAAATRPYTSVTPAGEIAEPNALRPAGKDLSEPLPRDVALLKVIPADVGGQPGFRLEGYFRGQIWTGSETDLSSQLKPEQSIGEVLDTADGNVDNPVLREAAVGYFKLILAWSRTKYSLHRWLTDLRRVVGADLRLVVWDDTDLGLPWELYRFQVDDQHLWLGAAMQVIRWTTIHDADRHDQFSAVRNSRPSGAEILCFEDRALVPENSHHTITNIALCTEMETLVRLCRALDSDSDKYGLVYVRAHGKYGGSMTTTTLGDIDLATFETLHLRAIRTSGSVVLLNACSSARPVFDPAPGDRANRNFAEIFLRHHARAVVATLGEVPIASSAALARKVVREARQQGVHLPELLRRRREDAARELPRDTLELTDRHKHAILSFLHDSLYVYFGHPDFVFTLGEPS
jgi:hypothetical protein